MPGDKGEQGDKGEFGDKGEQGDKGEIGDKGLPGDPADCDCCRINNDAKLTRLIARQTKTLSYAVLGQIGMLNQASDVAVNSGISRAMEAIGREGIGKLAGFFSFTANNDRYKTGGYIDVNGTSFIAGVAISPIAGFAVGVFGEFGKGNTDGSNGALQSESDNKYAGGGVMTRVYDILGSGLYLEATARMGTSKYDFRADGFLANASGVTKSAKYDRRDNYYSAHFGVGRAILLGTNISLDLSAKYLWSLQKSGEIDAAGERLELSSVHSHRVRAGGRARYAFTESVSVYSGAWLEHEFAAKSSIKSVASDRRYQGGRLTGASAAGELGVSIGSGYGSRWNIDVGVTGHVGRRRGIGGNAGFSISF